LLFFSIATLVANGQSYVRPSLNIGDAAPPLRLRAWLKGTPIKEFQKGKVYVVEFWSTWCAPCRAVMPHLSALAHEYEGRVTFIAVDILQVNTPVEKLQRFVDSMGGHMDFNVAAEESYLMESGWYYSARPEGIPCVFVVNADGKIAWIGHPMALAPILPKVLSNDWDMKGVSARRNEDMRLEALDDSLNYELMRFEKIHYKPESQDKPDSMLMAIAEITKKEPGLKYATHIVYRTFDALLKTNMDKAYKYAKEIMDTTLYGDLGYEVIIGTIGTYADKLHITPEIYQLGIDAYLFKIDHVSGFPELANLPKYYDEMAQWYSRLNDKSKAIEAQQKAIDELKGRNVVRKDEMMNAFTARLEQYKSM